MSRQLQRNHFLYALQVAPNVSIGESDHADAPLVQKARAARIALHPARVLVAVKLNSKAGARTIKVEGVRPDWMLTPKGSAELCGSQRVPKLLL